MCAVNQTAPGSKLRVGDVLKAGFRWFKDHFNFSEFQWTVFNAIIACRTGKLGAHVLRCTHCGGFHLVPLSCRNRHCPSCQGAAAKEWLARQEEALLPVPYFHVVFTLPHTLNDLIRVNQEKLYPLLFDAASETLLQFGRNNLGAQIGITAVLHTWGQTLCEHYHLHCIVTGGGLALDGDRWVSPPDKKPFLFPVKALSPVFRGKYIDALEKLYDVGELEFHGNSKPLGERRAFNHMVRTLYRNKWVVYSKRPFAGPEQVLAYLSRYTHRVAISDSRILALDERRRKVIIRYKDYRKEGRWQTLPLDVDTFIKRFSVHILPKRFTKIRHYGILGTRNRKTKIPLCRRLLGCTIPAEGVAPSSQLCTTTLIQSKSIPGPDKATFVFVCRFFRAVDAELQTLASVTRHHIEDFWRNSSFPLWSPTINVPIPFQIGFRSIYTAILSLRDPRHSSIAEYP